GSLEVEGQRREPAVKQPIDILAAAVEEDVVADYDAGVTGAPDTLPHQGGAGLVIPECVMSQVVEQECAYHGDRCRRDEALSPSEAAKRERRPRHGGARIRSLM